MKKTVSIPNEDVDIVLEFKNGQKIIIQCRTSNADINYEGSLDIILPYDQCVTCWQGDDMEPAQAIHEDHPETRKAKQLVLELPREDNNPVWEGCV